MCHRIYDKAMRGSRAAAVIVSELLTFDFPENFKLLRVLRVLRVPRVWKMSHTYSLTSVGSIYESRVRCS
jgi:hypothetical protein